MDRIGKGDWPPFSVFCLHKCLILHDWRWLQERQGETLDAIWCKLSRLKNHKTLHVPWLVSTFDRTVELLDFEKCIAKNSKYSTAPSVMEV